MSLNILLYIGLVVGIAIKFGNLKNIAKLITSKDAIKMISNDELNIILDVRTNDEYSNGSYPNAINLSYNQINEQSILKFDKGKNILVYCRSGRRAKIAADKLISLGFKSIYYIKDTYKSII